MASPTDKRWWLDERAHVGAEHLDPGYVAGYDRKAGFDPAEDVDALERLGLGPDAVVVDLGAGTGTFACAAARAFGRVVAVDVSPAMTAAMRKHVDELGLDNVSVVDGGFLSYEHRDDPADAIYSRNALHHLPDFWKSIALQRMASILHPGGLLRLRDLVFDFEPSTANDLIDAWMASAVTDASTGWTADELADHVRCEFSTYSWLLDAMLERNGFDIVDRSFHRSVYAAYTCRRPVP